MAWPRVVSCSGEVRGVVATRASSPPARGIAGGLFLLVLRRLLGSGTVRVSSRPLRADDSTNERYRAPVRALQCGEAVRPAKAISLALEALLRPDWDSRRIPARESEPIMATSSKAKRPSSTKANRLNFSPPPVSFTDPDEIVIPKVSDGITFGLRANEAPFWEPPKWGCHWDIQIMAVRDLLADPLTFEEFAQLATKNIGRYRLDVEDVFDRTFQVFWNDVLIVNSYEESGEFCWDEDADSQPYEQHPLQLTLDLSGHSLELGTFEATMAGRLALLEKFSRDRFGLNDDHLDWLRVRPVVADSPALRREADRQ